MKALDFGMWGGSNIDCSGCGALGEDKLCLLFYFFFFFSGTATTEIYTLSLHDALPIYEVWEPFPPTLAQVFWEGEIYSTPIDQIEVLNENR